MIVCASRRTDIPAFHSEWLMNRLRAGYCLTRNPVAKNVVHRIDLRPENLDMLLLMTKNPGPMVEHLDELSELNVNCSFQVTVNPYGREIEPGLPRKKNVIDSFKKISERIGKERMIWRYDPIVLNDSIDENYHKEGFGYILNELKGYTDRCIIGFVDIYKKLEGFAERGSLRPIGKDEMENIGHVLAELSKDSGISLSHCPTKCDLSAAGIAGAACISKEYMQSLNVPYEELDVPIREGCGCIKNIDIGDYDTCDHDCIYCYANLNHNRRRAVKRYDPKGELLFGQLHTDDQIVRLSSRPVKRITDF